VHIPKQNQIKKGAKLFPKKIKCIPKKKI